MKRALFLFLPLTASIALISLPVGAAANWLRIGENVRADIYIDNADVTRPRGHVKVWTMLSYKSRQRGGWLSERRLFLYGCKEHALAWQQSMYYANSMGEGDLLQVRTLSKYGVDDLRLNELDPSTKDKRIYRDAVPESLFTPVFDSMC